MQSIADVLLELDLIITRCIATNNRAGYFAALYRRMTAAVKKGIATNAFEDGERMEKLDILFAKRYIEAWDAYQLNKLCSRSWQYAFDACKNDDLIVMQHLLLGINTHINLDLAIAAALVAPGTKIDDLKKDFYTINSIINSLVDDMQECLCKVWFPMRMLTKIANGRQEAVLNFSIDKAREASWFNAMLLAQMTTVQQQQHISGMDQTVTQLATCIEHPGTIASTILNVIRKTEYNHVANIITLLRETVV